MVGATGLEPAASCSQSKHSTKLSYAPIFKYTELCTTTAYQRFKSNTLVQSSAETGYPVTANIIPSLWETIKQNTSGSSASI